MLAGKVPGNDKLTPFCPRTWSYIQMTWMAHKAAIGDTTVAAVEIAVRTNLFLTISAA